MNFSVLKDCHTKWRDIFVIGKTIERDGSRYHLVGMTLSDEARLYILEPYTEPESTRRKGIRNQRRLLKEHDSDSSCYLHCSDFSFGGEKLQTQGGTGGSLKYSLNDYGTLQLFLDMISAGWEIPQWLRETDWDHLQLVTLKFSGTERLPAYSPKMPITITHRPNPIPHILEKPLTLHVGKSRSFRFTDHRGEPVQCHINQVTLIDVWKDTAGQFEDPGLTERLSPEQLQQARKYRCEALGQNCPQGMCYIGIEYECSRDLSLVFYSRRFLSSLPETHHGSASFLLMRLKPDQETGTHGLPLKGCVIQTPVSPDTTRINAELFQYFEKAAEWTEIIP